jgi:high-affinity iron transporter
MLLGIVGALVLVIGLSWLALKLSRRLPLRSLFTASSLMMLALATILMGKGLHSVQETGILRVTSAPANLRWELLGVYPTLETLLGQIVVALAVIFLWFHGRKPSAVKIRPH